MLTQASAVLFIVAAGVTYASLQPEACHRDDDVRKAEDDVLLMQKNWQSKSVQALSSDEAQNKVFAAAHSLVQGHLRDANRDVLSVNAGLPALTQAMGQLAADVADGKTVLPDTTKDALRGIWDEMEKVFTGAAQDHDADQVEVDMVDRAVQRCDEAIVGNEGWGSDATSKNTAHDKCRAEEKGLRQKNATKCNDFHQSVADLSAPKCIFEYLETPSAHDVGSVLSCLEKMAQWAPSHKESLFRKESECTSATKEYRAAVEDCNRKQTIYENDFCGYHKDLTTKCEAYSDCRVDTIADQQQLHDVKKMQVGSRKATFVAAKHIQCFLKVLNATAAEQPNMLKECVNGDASTVNADQFNITFTTKPALACDESPVASRPCDSQWIATYQQKPWYGEAPTQQCMECAHLTTTTTTTTTTSTTTTTTTTQQMFGFAYSGSALKFAAPDRSPDGWTFSDADPTSAACNTWKWGNTNQWNRGEWGGQWKLENTIGLTIDGHPELDWRTDPGSKASQNYGANSDITLHFCKEVTLKQVIVIPWHHGHPLTANQLQYRDSSGAWKDSGAQGAQKPGYGLYRGTNNAAKYWVYGAASSAAVSKQWRVKGMRDTSGHSRGCGFQIVT